MKKLAIVGFCPTLLLAPINARAITFDDVRIGDPVSGYAAIGLASVNPVEVQQRINYNPGGSSQAFEDMFDVTTNAVATSSSVGASAKSTNPSILLGGEAHSSLFDPYTLLGNTTGSPIPLNFNFGVKGTISLKTDVTTQTYNLATASYSDTVTLFTDQGFTVQTGSIGEQLLNGALIEDSATGNVSSNGLVKADLGADVDVKLGDVDIAKLSFSVPVINTGNNNALLSSSESSQFLKALQDTVQSASITASSKLTVPELQQALLDGKLSFKLNKLDFTLQTGFSIPGLAVSGGAIDLTATAQASMIGSGSAQADFLDPLELLSVTVPGDYSGSLDGLSLQLAGGDVFPILREGDSVAMPEPAAIWLFGPMLAFCLAATRARRIWPMRLSGTEKQHKAAIALVDNT